MKQETRDRRLSYGVPEGATHVNPDTLMYYKCVNGVWKVWYGHCDLWCESHTAKRSPDKIKVLK